MAQKRQPEIEGLIIVKFKNNRTVAVIQARLGSERLPRKVLRPLGTRPMLDWVYRRVSRAETIDDVVVATTIEARDDELAEYCDQHRWHVFRGSEADVLSRFVGAAKCFEGDRIVRITSDCPFIDPALIDQVVGVMNADEQVQYACNFYPLRWFPRGLDVECIQSKTLESLDKIVRYSDLREHVTLAVYQNPTHFKIRGSCAPRDLSQHRWTADTESDWDLLSRIADAMGHDKFDWLELLALVEKNPAWQQLNAHVQQKIA